MKIKILVFLMCVGFTKVMAQNDEKKITTADIALAAGSGFSPAIGLSKTFGIGQKNKFKIGYGIRYTGFFASKEIMARTAPAKLTSGKSALAALFSEDIVSQIDTISLTKTQTHAINLGIHLGYALSKKLDIGFNIDAIGLTFGGAQSAKFIGNNSDVTGKSNNNKTFSASPSKFNLLLISDSDLGSLNSEIFARFWVTEKVGIRAGASFQFVEYTTKSKLAFDNDRFRSKQLLPMVALTVKL
jgi:hypothetical protein